MVIGLGVRAARAYLNDEDSIRVETIDYDIFDEDC